MLEYQLIRKCKNGDGDAFRRLIEAYRTRLFGYLWRFSETNDSAEDIFQETLIKAWKGLRRYDHKQKFSSWLFTIAHNVAIDNLRQRSSRHIFTNIDDLENNSSNDIPDQSIIENEMMQIINSCIKSLSEKQRAVFLLRQHGEMTFKEIAEATGEPLNTVISHMHYAVKKIRKQIEIVNEPRVKSIDSKF